MSYRANTSLAKKYVESEQQITHLLLQLRWDYILFAMEMDRLTDEVKQESLCTMMFTDNTVISNGRNVQVAENMEVCTGEKRNGNQ